MVQAICSDSSKDFDVDICIYWVVGVFIFWDNHLYFIWCRILLLSFHVVMSSSSRTGKISRFYL